MYRVYLWVQMLVDFLLSVQRTLWCHGILYHVIIALDCISNWHSGSASAISFLGTVSSGSIKITILEYKSAWLVTGHLVVTVGECLCCSVRVPHTNGQEHNIDLYTTDKPSPARIRTSMCGFMGLDFEYHLDAMNNLINSADLLQAQNHSNHPKTFSHIEMISL